MSLKTTARPALILALSALLSWPAAAQTLLQWSEDFPRTDFAARSIDLGEVVTYGRKDSIPPIDDPQFVPVAQVTDIGDFEPLVSIGINGEFRAYPLRVLLFHEIVNDVVGGVPVVVSYCAFCNSGLVFDRRLDGEVLEFGNTGTYRHFGMVLYSTTRPPRAGGSNSSAKPWSAIIWASASKRYPPAWNRWRSSANAPRRACCSCPTHRMTGTMG